MNKATCFLIVIGIMMLPLVMAKLGQVRRQSHTTKDDDYYFPPFKMATLTLVDADADRDVVVLTQRYLLDARDVPRFSIRADFHTTFPTKSVVFMVDNKMVRIEQTAPFALNGNNRTNYYPWYPTETGMTTFTAIPYSGRNATGMIGPIAREAILVRGYV
jgi:hypothetical protein